MYRVKITLLVLLCAGRAGLFFSQNNVCSNATPFCTGQTMNFPAGVNSGIALPGASYGCLVSQPNPAWFFMQIANSGPMSIVMSAANDIDFICWGPFPNLSVACSGLTGPNIQSCSYSAASTETCTIANAIAGQFYIMLITNFSNQNQNISFTQNNANNAGAATTNCDFVCVVSGTTSGITCSGQSVTVSLAPNTGQAVFSYTWTGPNGFNSNLASNVIPNVQASGNYSVIATSSAIISNSVYTSTCQAVVAVSVVPSPSFNLVASTPSICQGGSFVTNVVHTPSTNPNNFLYNWTSGTAGGFIGTSVNSASISPPLLPSTGSSGVFQYSVTVSRTSTLASCPITKTLAVTVFNPSAPTINAPPPFCDTFNPQQLTASPGGGTWTAAPVISPGGIFNPANALIGVNTVTYEVFVGSCVTKNTQTVMVSKFYSPALSSNAGLICVQDLGFKLMNIAQNTVTGTWTGNYVNNNEFNPSGLASGNYTVMYSTTSLPDSTTCPASTVLALQVFNPPVPVIHAISPRCSNSTSVVLTANPANGTWSGASGVSSGGVQTPSLNAIGTNTVIYASGQGTCVASTSRTFHVSQFISAALTGTIAHLCVSSNSVNLMSIVQNTAGVWQGSGIHGDVFNPAVLSTGIYTLTYKTQSSPNTTLCPHSQTIAVSVLNPETPQITQTGPFCSADSPVQLKVTPATGQWVSTSFLSGAGVFDPAKSPIGNAPVQYVIGTNTCNAQHTILISTEAFVSAAITSSIADQCTSGPPLNLSPVTLNETGHWSGSGIIGNSFVPSMMGSGVYTLTYNTSSSPGGLCPDNATVSVAVFSLALPSIVETGPYCNNAMPVQIKVSPPGGIFQGSSFGIISPAGLFNPAAAFVGLNTIRYSITSGPCVEHSKTLIQVEKFISADFEKAPEVAYCVNAEPFNLNSLVKNPGGLWSGGSGLIGNMFYPAKSNLGDNTITYQTWSSTNALLCPDLHTVVIRVKNTPEVSAVSNIYEGCAPLEVMTSSDANVGGLGLWTCNDASETQSGIFAKYKFTRPGSYNILFNYSDNEAKGCTTQTAVKTIRVFESPEAGFSVWPDEVTLANPEVTLTNLSKTLQNNKYLWTIEGLNQTDEINPKVIFPQPGKYKITLTASTIDNCRSEYSRFIDVKNDYAMYIPNSFTPNYDGINDVFRPVFSPFGWDTEDYSLEIFDRWGKQVFATNNFDQGWDGTISGKNGEVIKSEVYIFKLSCKDISGKIHAKTGNVTLLP